MIGPEHTRATFVSDFIRSNRAATYPVLPTDVLDEHRVIERTNASPARKLAIEVERAASAHKREIDAAGVASCLLAASDLDSETSIGLMSPKWISVARLLAHLEALGLDLPRDLSASIARRATIMLLNHHCGGPPSPEAPASRRRVPVAQAAPDHVDEPPGQASGRRPQEPLTVVVTRTHVGDARMCFECGTEVGAVAQCKVSGELHGVTWDDFPALAMQFVERAKAEHAALADQHVCPACGEPLVAQAAPTKETHADDEHVVHRARADRAIEGVARVLGDIRFQGEREGSIDTLAAGTVVDRVAATAKELTDSSGRKFVAIRWKNKTRFVRDSDVELTEETR
jgi:hypothetical protein